ncbi:MAG: chromosome segregation SMC family protein, partial [Acidimicrobiales bacterium]
MFLKALQIRGFKSFADKALLELEPGITVVVGPNGSGKSNVVDAIAWVLGAQAPTSVRSQKMDDVIFAGTAKRAALGRAEVSLTIDNTAGLLPLDFSEVTITRTLFRNGDSDYAINGVSCRLLDIQELLSDAGVGRNQHVIVSQGQIDAILNARPEERRSIIEEAAGILKYRRRKERAERRLAATEVDLSRVSDLQREIRRQLRPLERQAKAAREHGQLTAELQALRTRLAGEELVSLRARLAAARQRQGDAEAATAELTGQLGILDGRIRDTEAELRRHGGREVSELLGRFDTTTERIRGLAALIEERHRNATRLASLRFDEAGARALVEEAAEVESALGDAAERVDELEPQRAEASQAYETVVAEREALLAPAADGMDPLVARAGEVRREVSGLRSGLERAGGEVGRLADRQRSLTTRLEEARAELARLGGADGDAEAVEEDLARAVQRAVARRAETETDQTAAEEALREAQADQRGTQARVDVLAGALDAARARAGAARLRQLDGVVGTLLDAIRIDPGWEPAFEAAAGEALTAVVVADVDVAREALTLLAGGGQGGAVLPIRSVGAVADTHPAQPEPVVDLRDPVISLTDETPRALSLARTDQGTVTGATGVTGAVAAPAGEQIRGHVRGRDAGVDRLLDNLLAGAVRVRGGWDQALTVAVAHPELVVVSDDGDRFGPQGWRVGSSSTG